jgi:hypothetical protein
MNLSISRLRLGGSQVVNAGPSISVGLEYDKSAPSIRLFLTAARRGGVADTLEVTQFDVEDTDNLDLVTDEVSPELADTTAPGALTGATGQKVTAMSGAVADGLYLVSYEVTAADPDVTLFAFSGGPFPFVADQFPTRVGIHHVLITAEDAGTGDAIRKGGTGNITISALSIKRAEWTVDTTLMTAGDEIAFTIARGEAGRGATVTVPTANEIYVAPNGSDTLGTGAQASPYQSPGLVVLGPGDQMILEHGVYDPFEVQGNGADGNPAIVRSRPGFERQTIIRGDLQQHVAYGGPGVAQNNATRDGIRIAGKNHITIRGLTCEYVWRNGIFAIGNGADTVSGNIIIEDCFTQHTGLSGILVCGDLPENPVAGDDAFRMQQVRIRRNEVTQTNVVTDFNDTVENSFGEPGGVGEAITVANSVRYAYTTDNYVHTTRQYGIDYKNHVVDGEITGNRIDAAFRYAIYLDSGETDIRRILVANNRMSNCRAGLVLAREEDGNDSGDDLVMEDIDIVNNVTWNMSRVGLHFQRHPTKDQQNIGFFRRIRARFNSFFNTNTDGIYRDINIDDIAGFGNNIAGDPIVSGIELIGNVAWNPDGAMRMAIDVAGDSRFTVAQNYNVQDGTFTATDVLYVDPTAEEPDFNLGDGSGAKEIVTTASYITGQFALGPNGNKRTVPADAGAYAPEPKIASTTLAFNAHRFRDFYPGHMFLNLAKQMRGWQTISGDDLSESDLDDNGYPREIPDGEAEIRSYWIWGSLPSYVVGRYILEYSGSCTLNIEGVASIVSRTAAENGERIVFDVPSLGAITFSITAIPDSQNYPRNFVILKDDANWISRYNDGEVFTPEYLDMLMPNGKPLESYRHLNSLLVNDSTVVNYSEYPTETYATYTRGVPIKLLCELANLTGHAPWFCIPAMASDAFVTAMAAEVKANLRSDLAARSRVEYTNEIWNDQFDQNTFAQYKSSQDWGIALSGISITSGANSFVVSDATGLEVGKPISFGNDMVRRYEQPKITNVTGTTVTVDRGINLPDGTYTAYYGDFWAEQWYVKRAIEVMQIWETETGYPCVRVMGTQTASSSRTTRQLDASEWELNEPATYVNPRAFFDEVAVTSYIYSVRGSADRTTLLSEFDTDYQQGVDYALNILLNTENEGLARLDAQLSSQRAALAGTDLNMVLYEGHSDHTITGLSDSADDTRLWNFYADLVYSTAFDPVMEKLTEITKRQIDGPVMKYRDIGAPGKSGLWGMYRFIGDTNAHATSILSAADGDTPWWLPEYPPQKTDLALTTFTGETVGEAIDVSRWFTRNASTFSANNLPAGVTISGPVITIEATATEDILQTINITATTSLGNSVTIDLVLDLTYVAGPPAAMSVDAGKMVWWAPDSVSASNGTVTSITDKTGNGNNLSVTPSGVVGPDFDGDKMTFDGSTMAMRSLGTGPIIPELYNNAGEVAIFSILQPNPSTTNPTIIGTALYLCENGDDGVNNRFRAGAFVGNSSARQYNAQLRRFSSFNFSANITSNPSAFGSPELVTTKISQTSATIRVNGAEISTATPVVDNFPQIAQKISLGGSVEGDGSISRPFWGDIYEVFITNNASAANIAAIEAELAFKYGITLP